MQYVGQNILGRRNSQCKDPGVNCLVCLRKSEEEACVAGEWEVVRAGGDKQIVQVLVGHRAE